MPPIPAIQQAVAMFEGSPTKLAAAVGGTVLRQHIEHWLKAGAVPPLYAPDVERACNGVVTAEKLSPTTRWVRVVDPAWPHRNGRPLIDPASVQQAVTERRLTTRETMAKAGA